MKKQLLGLMTVLTVLGACQKNEVASLSEDVTIHATIEEKDVTRTVMDENNNILWSENDQIIAFMKSSFGYKYQVKPSFVGKSYAEFSMVSSGSSNGLFAGNEWEHNVSYYPYSENIECLKSGTNYELEVSLPSEQVYVTNSFANGSMAMVAVSENNNITFKNVLGGIKLQLKGTQIVKSIKIEGKNNEKLSGAAVVTAYTNGAKPAITMASGALASVTLNCGSGVELNESKATEFIISLPPVRFTDGFNVSITDHNGNTQVIKASHANEIIRSSILVMPEISLAEMDNGNYIDEYGIDHGPGIKIGETVWAPVNCGFHKDHYKYGKLYQWGRKYGQGFSEDGDALFTIEKGPVSASIGNHPDNADIFYTSISSQDYDWLDPHDGSMWNSGTEVSPIKTDHDPCPSGWRVPTLTELKELSKNYSSWVTENGLAGYWLSGSRRYTSDAAQIFLPAGGLIFNGQLLNNGSNGYYWSSFPGNNTAGGLGVSKGVVGAVADKRSFAFCVRCVQE